MNKQIVGGLLVVSLLSKPALLRIDYVAYEIYRAQTHIIAAVKRIQEEIVKTDAEKTLEVNSMMEDIDKNNHKIKKLLKEKNTIYGKIQSAMNVKARTKEILNDEQIAKYQNFHTLYANQSKKINKILTEMESMFSLTETPQEILKENMDYEKILGAFQNINDVQYEAIYSLCEVIEIGENTLAYL